MESTPTQKKANELLAKLFETAKPTAVFSPPVISGDYILITAAEVTAVFGAGYGGGVGVGPGGARAENQFRLLGVAVARRFTSDHLFAVSASLFMSERPSNF